MPAGASVVPAVRRSTRPTPEPALAHLGHLFMRPRYWGSGLATQLLKRAAVREGYRAVGEPFDTGLGLPMLEYRGRLDA